jgi:hypothetical protein
MCQLFQQFFSPEVEARLPVSQVRHATTRTCNISCLTITAQSMCTAVVEQLEPNNKLLRPVID